ncbi:glycoside hydrolase family 10 protein [filamentous cyanobacterium LEGE 11480]|uniref:Glycoside hydrolase family 10 protein n=1 Tax=Romeriopsis navalis LEGE 11480 TaxID=2777977 RepID=A0A928VNI4_9CYAN|nr:glycoside hydrolase family 10 protein [Romeriopsis navalis]MBE9029662.1 glycoside hydrolase family 10 protein [Romeriopsis navalis LEGE 11480]
MNWFFTKRFSRSLLAIGTCLLVLLSAQAPNVASAPKSPLEKQLNPPALFKKSGKTPKKSSAQQKAAEAKAKAAKAKAEAEKKASEPLFPTLRPPEEIRGVWLTNNDMTVLKDRRKLGTVMNKLSQLKFNTLYPVIWNSGYVTYPSQVAKKAGIQPFVYRGTEGQDILADVIAQGRRQKMLVIPWFEFGFMAPQTSELAINHPDWLTQQRNGKQTSISAAGEVAWLNPFRPEVQKFITDLVVEAVSNYDVDGIQFDDHMSLPYTFGYDPYTVALYKKEMKKDPPTNPKDAAWTKWRADKLTEFMVKLKQEIRQRKPNAIVSVSPNYAAYAYKFQLQDWHTWVKKGVVDELIVQVYRSDLRSFKHTIMRSEMVEARKKIPTAVGILTGLRRRPVPLKQVQSQVYAANERGMGTVFFYLESLWSEGPESPDARQSGLKYLFPRTALRPRS